MNRSLNIFLLLILFATACDKAVDNSSSVSRSSPELQNTNKIIPLEDFIFWTADAENELVKNKKFSEINYSLSHMPTQSLAYIELKGQDFTNEQFNSTCKNYSGMSYFNLRIELPSGSGELLKHELVSAKQYNDRITYMSFEMQNDIFLVQGNDTLKPGLFHFERIFEVASYSTVMLAFDNEKFNKEKEFTIIYDDHLFNKGYIKYTYYNNQLIDLPNISGV